MALDKAVDSTILDGYFTDIADAIRQKGGTQATLTPAQMPGAINNMQVSDPRVEMIIGGETGGTLDLTDLNITSVGNLADLGDALHPVTAIALPTTVTEIRENCFKNDPQLTTLTGIEHVTTIGSYAFSNTSQLDFNIPSTLTDLAGNACQLSGITTVDVPAGVTVIKGATFANCTKLKEVKIRQTAMGENNFTSSIFRSDTSLEYVWIADECTTIYANNFTYAPFNGCSKLTDIYCEASSAPSGWQSYWNNTTTSKKATVHYGVSESDFDLIVNAGE